MTDENLMREARRRVKAKKEFRLHVVTYVAVNIFLVAFYFITDRDGSFWPLWPMLGWGFGLVLHGLTLFSTLFDTGEKAVQAEYERLKGAPKDEQAE